MKKIRLLDTFAGIGGFHLGVKQACNELDIDFECVGAIEFDKNAKETYKENFPNVEMFDQWNGDITKIPLDKIPDHDILTGGFPCQPFSRNNMTRVRRNADQHSVDKQDERSILFTRLVDILNHKKPSFFVFENVKQLINMKYDGVKVIDTIVSECESVGYNVNYKVINAADFNVAQQRLRVFIIGVRNDIDKDLSFPLPINSDIRVKDILELSVPDHLFVKNSWKNRRTQMNGPNHNKNELRLEVLQRNYKNLIPERKILTVATINNDTPSKVSRQHDRIYSIYGISRTLATFAHPAFDMGSRYNKDWRMLSVRECARLQGFSDSFIFNNSENISLKQLGNAVCVNVVYYIVKELL